MNAREGKEDQLTQCSGAGVDARNALTVEAVWVDPKELFWRVNQQCVEVRADKTPPRSISSFL